MKDKQEVSYSDLLGLQNGWKPEDWENQKGAYMSEELWEELIL